MVDEADELEKVKRNVTLQWKELHSEFPENERASPAYLARWNRIHAYDQVQSSAALGIPLEGRLADAAVDAKTSTRLLELILERQTRAELKIDQLINGQRQLSTLSIAMSSVVIVYAVFQWFAA